MMWWTKHYDFKDIPDLSSKVAIVTGSNTGIGKVCATELTRKGCHVVLACRTAEKAEKAIEEIKTETGSDKLEFIALDLLSLDSVRQFAETFQARHDKLHFLINNAGIMMSPFGLSKDGIETQFATNHVAHFYLTMLLLPRIEASAPSRIVNISSMAHTGQLWDLDMEDLAYPKHYNKYLQYSKTKACNILFTRELARRLADKGVENVYVNCNHPGVVRSDIYRHLISADSIIQKIYNAVFTISTEEGALTQLYLATSPDVEEKDIKGQYYVPYARPGRVIGAATSDKQAKELWEFTEKLLAEKVPSYKNNTYK